MRHPAECDSPGGEEQEEEEGVIPGNIPGPRPTYVQAAPHTRAHTPTYTRAHTHTHIRTVMQDRHSTEKEWERHVAGQLLKRPISY